MIKQPKSDIINITENSISEERGGKNMRSMKAIKAMNQKLKQAVEKQENVILDEFLQRAKRIEEYLTLLELEGVDQKRFICVEGHEEWQDIAYDKISEETLKNLLKTFRELKADDSSMEAFRKISEEGVLFLYTYHEYEDMDTLMMNYEDIKAAENFIE